MVLIVLLVFQGRYHHAITIGNCNGQLQKTITMGRYHNHFRKLDNLFFGKEQGAVSTDRIIYFLLVYNFCVVGRIFKVAIPLSIFSTT